MAIGKYFKNSAKTLQLFFEIRVIFEGSFTIRLLPPDWARRAHPFPAEEKSMGQGSISSPVRALPQDCSSRFQAALIVLLEAHDYATTAGDDPWQFAVELAELRLAGLTNGDVRCLQCHGYLDHAVEQTKLGNRERAFRRTANLALSEKSCFVLSAAGVAVVRQEIELYSLAHPAPRPTGAKEKVQRLQQHPSWDKMSRTLSWRGGLVKQFRLDAANQQAVLEAFEEKGWAHCIVVVLPVDDGVVDATKRLHDTLKNLNRSVRPHLRFNQAGSKVAWEPL
jgi:hypothetical protein